MNFRQLSFDGVSFIAPNWEECGKLTFEVFKLIDISGKRFDRVVALAKGGWTFARALVDFLKIEELDSIRIKLYEGINERADEASILRPLAINVTGEEVLIFDDLVDSGATMEAAKKHILGLGAKSVSIATLIYKPRSSVKPDFYAYETSAWVVFPHEIREFVEETYKDWKTRGVNNEDIIKRYGDLGLNLKVVEYLLKK